MNLKIYISFICLFGLILSLNAQDSSWYKDPKLDSLNIVKVEVVDGDTVFVDELDTFVLKWFEDEESKKKFEQMVKDIKRVLPYAKLAAFRLQMMEDNLHQINGKRARKKYIKATEKAIRKEFTEDIKELHRRQGILLLKLIHRETGQTAYEILTNYRNNASYFFYQTWASFYNADLKDKYDMIEDHQVEYIIKYFKLEE